MDIKFAYRDKYGIIHVVANQANAEKRSVTGKVKAVLLESKHGYPCIENEGELIPVFDYGNGEIYVGGNVRVGKHISKVDSGIKFKVEKLLQEIGL